MKARGAVSAWPVETGRSAWLALAAQRRPHPALQGQQHADFLVIGAGFAGLTAARRLTEQCPEARVVVLEAQTIAEGPAGRNSGYMIDVPHDLSSGEYASAAAEATALDIARNRVAIDYAKAIAAHCGMDAHTFDPSGKVNAAATERGLQHNQNYAESLSRIGEVHRLLDAQAMRDLTGSRHYLGGLYTPGAVMIQPAEYMHALAQSLCPHVGLFEQSPVTHLAREGGVWTARTPQGAVSAPRVILAVNGHLQHFGHVRGRLMHVFTYASMSEGMAAHSREAAQTGAPRWALLPADPMGATVRKITDRQGQARILVRTRFTYDPSMAVSMARVQAIARTQHQSMIARFPELAAVPMAFSWAGRLCLSLNQVPVFGEIDSGLFSACVSNGLGTVKGTLAGLWAADLAAGRPTAEALAYADQAPPKRLPPEPLAWLGVNAAIRWQEWRAGAEA